MNSIKTKDFDLSSTVESGQIFRFEKENEGYRIQHQDQDFYVKQNGKDLDFEGTTPEFLTNFFQLDVDYEKIKKELSKDKALKEAIQSYPGIHLLNQDPWECTVSFICSSASNIKKIQMNLKGLAKEFGNGSFPKPGQLDDHQKILDCKTGYRAKYLFSTNKKVNKQFFEELKQMNYKEAKEKLMSLDGIGPKVADCICLFSLGHTAAFPVDVWIKRVMEELYFNNEPQSEKNIREFANKKWGKLAGYAQQYLYHWRRLQ
jgi:N-glycosylase/DNA lyase